MISCHSGGIARVRQQQSLPPPPPSTPPPLLGLGLVRDGEVGQMLLRWTSRSRAEVRLTQSGPKSAICQMCAPRACQLSDVAVNRQDSNCNPGERSFRPPSHIGRLA